MLRLIQNVPKIFRPNEKNFRSFATAPNAENKQQSKQKVIYKRVYHSKEVVYFSIVSKMKIYTGAIALCAFPLGNIALMVDPTLNGIDILAFVMGK